MNNKVTFGTNHHPLVELPLIPKIYGFKCKLMIKHKE